MGIKCKYYSTFRGTCGVLLRFYIAYIFLLNIECDIVIAVQKGFSYGKIISSG